MATRTKYIAINKVFNINTDTNLFPLILELDTIKKADALFNMKHLTFDDILNNDNLELLIKDSIR